MPSFTPPTYGVPLNPETQGGEAEKYSMWRHYGGAIQTAYSVLITNGAATPAPGVVAPNINDVNATDPGSGEGGLSWFRGGQTYQITDAEGTILEEAGYELDDI